MGKAEEYRQYAKECLELSAIVEGSTARGTLVQMAQVWLRLAQEIEEPSKTQGDDR